MRRIAFTCLFLAGFAYGDTPEPPVAPTVTVPSVAKIAVGERLTVKPIIANGGIPKWFLPDPTGLKEDRTYLDLVPPDVQKQLTGRMFYSDTPGTFRVVVYCGGPGNTASDIATCIVTVGDPVPPGPGPGPGPTPDPDPFLGVGAAGPAGLKVLILTETSDQSKLPRGQLTILTSGTVRDYLNSHCLKESGRAAWRVWDRDVNPVNETALWQKAFAAANKAAVPQILIGDGNKGFSGPLPTTVDETMKLLIRFGGA